jgi:hypothetical protein
MPIMFCIMANKSNRTHKRNVASTLFVCTAIKKRQTKQPFDSPVRFCCLLFQTIFSFLLELSTEHAHHVLHHRKQAGRLGHPEVALADFGEQLLKIQKETAITDTGIGD